MALVLRMLVLRLRRLLQLHHHHLLLLLMLLLLLKVAVGRDAAVDESITTASASLGDLQLDSRERGERGPIP